MKIMMLTVFMLIFSAIGLSLSYFAGKDEDGAPLIVGTLAIMVGLVCALNLGKAVL